MGKTLGMVLLAIFVAFMGKALFRAYWKYEATHGVEVSAPLILEDKTTTEKSALDNIEKCLDRESCGIAASQLETFCERGNAHACYELYRIYDVMGSDFVDKAILSAEKACDGGYVGACHELGWLYYSTYSKYKTDFAKSREYYDKACKLGHSASCSFVAEYYEKGEGIYVDYFKAREYYEKACSGGYLKACNKLGYLYENGNGVRVDFDKAMEYYGKACDLGEQEGCDSYKQLYLQTQ